MNYLEVLNDIEDKENELNANYYYHAFDYDIREFISMVMHGIKSRILLFKHGVGNNGLFYVSLSRCEECDDSAYKRLYNLPKFIINPNIKVIKTRNYKKYGLYPIDLSNTFLPLRESGYDDEYQKFLLVSPKNIIGIEYNLYDIYIKYGSINYYLEVLKSMVEDLKLQKRDIPIIDKSSKKEINKNKVLTKSYSEKSY